METVKLEGEKEIKTCIKLLRKVDVNSNNNYVIIMWHIVHISTYFNKTSEERV